MTTRSAPKWALVTTYEQALAHKWFGRKCPQCGAEPGKPCLRPWDPERPYMTIHGKRT